MKNLFLLSSRFLAVISKHNRPDTGENLSWLTFIVHLKDSLWSIDLFRHKSINAQNPRGPVRDTFTRCITVFGVHIGNLEENLGVFQDYYRTHRVPRALDLNPPAEAADEGPATRAILGNFEWRLHCNGLFQTPIAA